MLSATEFMQQFSQTTASKSFVQRELDLTMAVAAGQPALPILLEALLHPSMAGKAKVVDACVKYASDEQLLAAYHRGVPAIQTSLKESLSKADPQELLPSLGEPDFCACRRRVVAKGERGGGEGNGAIYVAWENQVNKGVSPVPAISQHILSIVHHCLALFAGNPKGVFFEMALQILWARCRVRVEFIIRATHHATDVRDEADELAFRTFLTAVDKYTDCGFWRIRDETAYVEFMYRRNQEIYAPVVFDEANPAYGAFVQAMLGCLGTRWERVPRLCEYVERQMGVIRGARGTGDAPAEWDKAPVSDAVVFMLGPEGLSRGMQTWPCDENDVMHTAKLDALVELLLRTDDTAVYPYIVSQHLINVRQDLLLDRFITTHGVFNLAPPDYAPGDTIKLASWDFRSAARFSPHQCEVFGEMFLGIIRSDEFPLQTRVRATEQFTKLPTTTIHELAALLTEDGLNPRIWEAILMFLPRLDEPGAGIQFLLAPAILAGELARTAVHSVKRSLEHVPLASVPSFLEPPTAMPLKIGVFKELVRIIITYIELPEMQDLVKRLWDRRLHQDVRIALLQSILPVLDSPQQDLAWYIIDKAVASVDILQADNTLFVLLAVVAEVPAASVADCLRTYLPRSPVLSDMATVTISKAHCERYVETVLWPLTQIRVNAELAKSIKPDKKKSAELVERILLIRSSSYIACFNSFLHPKNAASFAERAANDARELVDVDLQGYKPNNNFGSLPEEQLFLYLTECIGRCVAQEQQCWRFLLDIIGLLASRVAYFQRDATAQGHRSVKQLHALRLADNFLFNTTEFLCLKVTHDRMELLKPLAEHGVEGFFATTIYERRFNIFHKHVARVSKNGTGEDILPEARALLAENNKLLQSCHHTLKTGIDNLANLLYQARVSVERYYTVGPFNVGVTESKQEAVKLLVWWTETFLSTKEPYTELVDAEGHGDAVVRVTALEKLRKASDFVGKRKALGTAADELSKK
ncbi:hypothetical protein B0H16DRAFT_1804376 [Mycena metata]|uniref:Uncharacterized protein n=1 Tax=Mycena metata TaxID=1033252 RepID=A0AAD7NJ51_9AGAR|nr:hypothetical protein B0H16DRAFT_1804376 [Mycena metata]